MSRLYNVNSICLRYVVPFLFEGSFEDSFDKVETKKNNERKRKKCLGEKKGGLEWYRE